MYKPSHESALIITHKHEFIQPNLLEFPKKKQIGADSSLAIQNISSEIQSAAFSLYDIGLNPFPLPLGKKGGYPWKQLQYTRLDRNHEQSGLFMLFSGQCNIGIMCGRTSRNLFVIDCETQDALEFHKKQMQLRNLPLWISETQRGGHIYMFSADGEVTNIPTGTLFDAEIKGSKGYILAPPSLHPSGKPYTWLMQETNEPPTVNIQQIDWLCDVYGNQICLEAHQPRKIETISTHKKPYSPLSRRTQEFIRNGHTIAEGSRNNELFSASCDMAGNNYTQQETLTTLSPPAQASGLSDREIITTIKSAFSQPRTPSKPRSSQHIKTSDWQWMIIFADNHNWSGRTATSQRAIFTALIHRAKVSLNEDGLFRASIREIASLSRTGTATVQRILKDFQNRTDPFIIKCGYDKNSQATLWKFSKSLLLKAQQFNLDTLEESPQWLSCSVSIFSLPDSVERTGLGYNGLLVYRMMVDYQKAVLPKEIATLTGLESHQVKYVLKKLRFFELIYRVDEGWLAYDYDDETLDIKVDEKKSVIGKGKRRSERFKRERSIYAGQQLFNARLRYERGRFKRQVVDTLRDMHNWKVDRSTELPVLREIRYAENTISRPIYQRVTLSELDKDDLSWIECGLALGAEVIIQEIKH